MASLPLKLLTHFPPFGGSPFILFPHLLLGDLDHFQLRHFAVHRFSSGWGVLLEAPLSGHED